MIALTRFNGVRFYINAELIQTIETTPDTIITLTNNVKLLVREPASVVAERVIEYQRLVRNPELTLKTGE